MVGRIQMEIDQVGESDEEGPKKKQKLGKDKAAAEHRLMEAETRALGLGKKRKKTPVKITEVTEAQRNFGAPVLELTAHSTRAVAETPIVANEVLGADPDLRRAAVEKELESYEERIMK
eukprot:880890-Pyramimonas_sp.AAC.1